MVQRVKHLSAMQETWGRLLGWEDPLEKEMAAHSSTLAWKIPWIAEPGRLPSMGFQRLGHNWKTSLSPNSVSNFISCYMWPSVIFFLKFPSVSSVRSLSRVWLFATPWIAAHQAFLSITNSRSSLRLTSIESVMPSSHLILCCPLLLPSIFPSIRIFSNELVLRIR